MSVQSLPRVHSPPFLNACYRYLGPGSPAQDGERAIGATHRRRRAAAGRETVD